MTKLFVCTFKLVEISQNAIFSPHPPPPPPSPKVCGKKSTASRQVGHVCLATAGGPMDRGGMSAQPLRGADLT